MQEHRDIDSSRHEAARTVASIVDQLLEELHTSGAERPRCSSQSSLDRDLGLDSLTRLELLTRLQGAFGSSLDAERVVLADSVDDIVRAVTGERSRVALSSAAPIEAASLYLSAEERVAARALPEILSRVAERAPSFPFLRLVESGESCEEVEAGGLLKGAREIAAGLSRLIEVGEPVAIMLPTGVEFIEVFFGVQMAGGVPVPLAPAPRPSQIEDHLRRQVQILDDCRAGLMIAAREVTALARLSSLRAKTVRRVATADQVKDREAGVVPWRAQGDDIALLQYTSGSTGAPKGVVLTHANLLANLEAIARALETGPDDVFVSWLPLYHDMGLIGGLLHPLYCGIPLVLMSPLAFLARPELWIEAIDRYGGTMTVAPNFAYEICQRRAARGDFEVRDLSRWRLALNGAEPVSPATIDRFCARFEPFGFNRRAMLPVYGLAENSLAVTFPELGRPPRVDRVAREDLLIRGHARPAGDEEESLEFVSCGRPIHQVELRVIDDAGRDVVEREVGRVQFRGRSATQGYYRNSTETRRLFDGDWIDSGDLGYQAGGHLYLTGRSKDIIIHAGRNLSPHALEEAAGDVEDIRKGCVAVFGVVDGDLGTERLIVVAETREGDAARRGELVGAINSVAARVVGVTPDDVCLAPPHTLLKTSSGKIRRRACRRLYLDGTLASGSRRAIWRQMAAAVVAAGSAGARSVWRSVPRLLYSFYAWILAAGLLAAAWLGVLVLPRLSWRYAWARGCCRLFFRAAGVRLDVSGVERLTAASGSEGMVLASNHGSYLDAMVLIAALPNRLSFVAKRDFEDSAVTRVLMRRLGAGFVDQGGGSDPHHDLNSWAAQVARGETLAVFVEGTFVRAPGLRRFKLGAFEVATRARRPVCPVVINGSRELLRDEQWWFQRGPVAVEVGVPQLAVGDGFAAAVKLRDATRREMVYHLTEPDLAASNAGAAQEHTDAAEERIVVEGGR